MAQRPSTPTVGAPSTTGDVPFGRDQDVRRRPRRRGSGDGRRVTRLHARPRPPSRLALVLARHAAAREVLPLVWLIVVTAAYLGPALHHGASLGPYDLLGQYGITQHVHASVHNVVGSDEIEEFIPWQSLAWTEVHAGQLPLWNPYNLLGTPLAFNFESAPFSATVAVGYLFPLRLAHTATVVSALLLAGSGGYVFGRVLGLGRLASLVAGTTYELSGAFTIWLGWYESNVMAWAGWIFAASVLVLRGRHRARDVSLLALALALALLAGEPQIAVVVVGSLAVFVGVVAVPLRRSTGRTVAARACTDHLVALLASLALAAPVYLPAAEVVLRSSRSTGPKVSGLPLHDLTHLLFASYDGLPTALGSIVGPDNLYVSMLYVGVIGVGFALLALPVARRRPEVRAMFVLAAGVTVVLFASPVVGLLGRIPYADVFRIVLAAPMLDFALAVLAGVGCDALVRPGGERASLRSLVVAIALLALVLAYLGARLLTGSEHLTPAQGGVRAGSFAWPAIGLVALAAVTAIARHGGDSARRRGALVLLIVESSFLVTSGAGIWSSSPTPFVATSSVRALQRDVGSSLVGIGYCPGTNAFPSTGILPDVNVDFAVHEFAAYDPIVPLAYHVSYGEATGTSTGVLVPPGLFCPSITSLALARLYGVSYILEPRGDPGPAGTTRVAVVGGEGLYAVPGASRATLVPSASSPGHARPVTAADATQPGPSSWRVAVDPTQASVLRLRVTAEPGWSATIDGRPLALHVWDHVMLDASVPPGHHVVELRYWPSAFSVGLASAGAAALGLVGAPLVVALRRRRLRTRRAAPDLR